jgi:hypothetical protein
MNDAQFLKRISDLSIEKKQCEDKVKEIETIQDELIRMHFREANKELFQ